MKTKILLVLLPFLWNYSSFSQEIKNREAIKALKTAFITTELDLTAAEAEKFWPIYNQFEAQFFELRYKKMKKLHGSFDKKRESLTEKEATALLSEMALAEEELFVLRKKLYTDLKGVVSSVKLFQLKKAEDDFNRKLLHQYRADKGSKN